jgi:CDP-diacylglycerol--inositol 3-phosphatidyltransferase
MAVSPVWFFVANLIGYTRVILGLASFIFAFDTSSQSQRSLFLYFYVISYFLDAIDGVAARALNQTSKFGAVLDMATDRICTAGLLALLAHYASINNRHIVIIDPLTWPPFIWIWLAMLDIFSHWLQMYSSLLAGSASHKTMTDEVAFVRWYYNIPYALFVVCLAHESFLAMTLVSQWAIHSNTLTVIPFPFALQIIPFTSLTIADFVRKFTLPFFLFKTLVSILQLVTAAQRIVTIDETTRLQSYTISNNESISRSYITDENGIHIVSIKNGTRGSMFSPQMANAATSTSTSSSSSSSRRRRPSSVAASAVALSAQARSGIADLMQQKETRLKQSTNRRSRSSSRVQ